MFRCWGPHRGWVPCAPTPWLLLSLLVCAAPFGLLGEETRQVSMEVISGWPNPQNLLHIRAVGSNSTLHYVWSSLGPPAVVLVATNTTQSVLSVNWSLLLSPDPDGALLVLPKNSIQFSSALVFTRLLEFDSTKVSEGTQPPGKPYPPYSLAKFSWNNITNSLDLSTLSTIFQGHPVDDPTGAFANGSLTFKVQAFTKSGRPAQPPRLLHTADVCQLEVALVGASPRGNHSLFGLELNQLLWGSSPSGFMQWRPVAFSEEERARESALPCQASTLRTTLAYSLPHSPIVQAFFGSQNNFCAFNLTFGAPTGPGYWDQRYLCWSMLLGMGFPPLDAFSPLVLGIMAVALGAPGLMFLGGGLFLLLHHKQYSEYQSIN
ncbi:glycosylated lysosomal membrane protein isoform X2 [Grammomys surdaster]|uniref:glycosylated lysosomal membrane protein isoform X2 n=1 Tax=Grammomys surdaster TaxID=491861 RepID=UPI0010A02219|nr:glycosylated lysosomal membrane protein isoform X2 [Grammomys surdaster]